MNTLKQVIHYTDTNSVEATWVDSETEQVVRCHSYDQYQMGMLKTDLGEGASEYESIYEAVQANWREPEPVLVFVPQIITNYQGKVTLDAFQLLDDVEAYMALEDTPKQYKLAWATGAFERQSALLVGIAALFSLTDEQIDAMFIYGAGVA